MRIAIGQLWQETNSFNPLPTTRKDFEPFGIHLGPELVERLAEINETGGFIQELRQWPEKPEIDGLARFLAWPSGPATPETLERFFQEMLEQLQKSLPVDGVLLSLHGAMVGREMPDVEGELLERVRAVLGPKVPLVVTLDMHVNLTRKMVKNSDGFAIYHCVPHIDIFETGQRGARLLRRILVDGARPVRAFQKVPMVVPAERANTQNPDSVSHGLREKLKAWEKDPDILAANLSTVQPWIDVPEMGGSVLIVATDRAKAEARCRELAAEMWAKRRDFLPELVDVPEAVKIAFAEKEGLVVLGDGADATTSGSTGDGTAALVELLKYDWPRPALVTLVAPEIVNEAGRRGVGAQYTATVGGALGGRNGAPVTLPILVANLFEAKFALKGHIGNLPIDMGPAAVLRHGNVHIIVTTRSGAHFAPELFQTAGLDPFAASVLIAKSPCGFRAAYHGKAKKILSLRAPGCAPADFTKLPYERIPRPLWPWDEINDWEPRPEVFGG